MIKIASDLRQRLAAVGYTTYTAQTTRTMSPATLAGLLKCADEDRPVRITGEVINTLCMVLDCQPADLLRFEPGEGELANLSDKWPGFSDAREAAARSELEARIADLQGQLARMESGRDPQVRE